MAAILDGLNGQGIILLGESRSLSPNPITSKSNGSGAGLHGHIIHEQEDIFVTKDTCQVRDGDLEVHRTLVIPIPHLFNLKKRSKRSSSSSIDARDRFIKSRSISDSLPIPVPPTTTLMTPRVSCYELDGSSKFVQGFTEFSNGIKYINQDNFIKAVNWYYTQELPNVDKMFPWLHGLHKYNIAQRRFLLQNIDQHLNIDPYKLPLDVSRFLTLIRSGCIQDQPGSRNNYLPHTGLLKGTIDIDDILLPLQSPNPAKLRDSINSAFIMLGLKEEPQFSRDMIVQDCLELKLAPQFRELDPTTGVSLRNFHIQISKVSHLTDFIVYCFNTDGSKNNCKCESIARILKIAQLRYQRDHLEIPVGKFNCYILQDYNPFEDKGNLISVKPIPLKVFNGTDDAFEIAIFNDWHNNTLLKEKLEISKMSSATHVYRNVWFGNTSDFNVFHSRYSMEADNREILIDQSPLIPNNNPPFYCTPENTITNITELDFQRLNPDVRPIDLLINKPKQNWKLFINCYDGARFPSLNELRDYLIHCCDDYYDNIYLEFPPSGSIAIGDIRDDKISSIVNVCKLLYYKCGQNDGVNKFSGLIYCSDGYSETSLLGLCYLIYSEGLKLDDAILKLHMEYGRPFFIFKSDYTFLEKIQKVLLRFSPTRPDYVFEPSIDILDKDIMLSIFVPKKIDKKVFFRILDESNGSLYNDSSDLESEASSLVSDDDKEEETGVCAMVSGSLPSRILPHLYLGSLNHANNLPMLNELGITRIVSVGERLGWISDYECVSRTTESGCEVIEITDSVSRDHSVKDLCLVDSVMYMSNINDDGIGTLTKTINDALNHIDEGVLKGEKILVHCQVGVSRSATVCIAEVMKRLNISLIRAYLYVRVRRLNVIIQPNLKLTYELFKWEENVVKSGSSMINALTKLTDKKSSINTEKERSSFNSLFSNPMTSKSSISRSSLSTSISSTNGTFDSSIDNSFFSFRVGNSSDNKLKQLSKNQVFISDDEIEEEDEEDDSSSETSANMTISVEQGDSPIYNGLITNNSNWLREVDWLILCREIYYLNKAYTNHG